MRSVCPRKTPNQFSFRLCRIEFGPQWIWPVGLLIQKAVLKVQQIFHVESWTPETGGHYITTSTTDKICTLPSNYNPTCTVIITAELKRRTFFDTAPETKTKCQNKSNKKYFEVKLIARCPLHTLLKISAMHSVCRDFTLDTEYLIPCSSFLSAYFCSFIRQKHGKEYLRLAN